MSVRKSPPPPISQQGALTKRARVDDDDQDDGNDGGMTMTVASSGVAGGKGALVRSVKRTSGLAAPIVSLGGAHRVSPVDLGRGGRCVFAVPRCQATDHITCIQTLLESLPL
jgi:hypothetical protein